jgi:predicted dehydrogenase
MLNDHGCWVSRGRQTTWDGDWFIDCEGGQIRWADNRVYVRPQEVYYTVFLKGWPERDGWMQADLASDLDEERTFTLEEFGRSIDEGREPETSGRDNLGSMPLTHAVAGRQPSVESASTWGSRGLPQRAPEQF